MTAKSRLTIFLPFFFLSGFTQTYPQGYFRNPLAIPMQLVANFGEIRNNHWHMGLDIRTQQKVNLPVYAAADGYITRVSVEPGGFGQAIYINHPNGYTTVYGHLNAFNPALAAYIKEQQYKQESWRISLNFSPGQFPVKKGDLIALSGSTGASEGPHVHFEIRDTKTENCLNPLLFSFPIADAVPPTLMRLVMYDRSRSNYAQTPKVIGLKKTAAGYILAGLGLVKTGYPDISFSVSTVDHFSNSANPNGIYSAKLWLDGQPVSGFTLDNISYTETRYINAQIDYRWKTAGGPFAQSLSALPGAAGVAYQPYNGDGIVHLTDTALHQITIQVGDAANNLSVLHFVIQYNPALAQPYLAPAGERFLPDNVNILERPAFELFTSEKTVYDTVGVTYAATGLVSGNTVSPAYTAVSAAIPAHDSVTVRIKPSVAIPAEWWPHILIKNVAGGRSYYEKAIWQGEWLSAKFRQFGSYQAFVDDMPPTVNPPGAGDTVNLTRSSRLIFTPRDNFGDISSLRVTVDGQWLCFTNDKGHSWIYSFDERFPAGVHQLKVTVEDRAGNVTVREWWVRR